MPTVSPIVSFPPSFARTSRETSGYEAGTRPYLNEIPPHFIHEIRTKGYDVIGMSDSPTKKGLIRPVRYIYKIKTGVGYCVSQLFPFFEKIQKMGDNENPADLFIG